MECTNLKDKFHPSPSNFFHAARSIFGVIIFQDFAAPSLENDAFDLQAGRTDLPFPANGKHSQFLVILLAANRAYDFMLTRIKSRLHQLGKREDGHSSLPSIPQGLGSVNTELSEITGRFARVVGHNMAVFAPFYEDILVEIKGS